MIDCHGWFPLPVIAAPNCTVGVRGPGPLPGPYLLDHIAEPGLRAITTDGMAHAPSLDP